MDRRVAAGAANGSAGVDVCVGVGCVVVADDRDGMRHVKQYPAREVARIRKNDDGCLEAPGVFLDVVVEGRFRQAGIGDGHVEVVDPVTRVARRLPVQHVTDVIQRPRDRWVEVDYTRCGPTVPVREHLLR